MSFPIREKAIQSQTGKIWWGSIKGYGLSKAPRRKHWIGGVYPPKNYYKQCLGLIFIFLSFRKCSYQNACKHDRIIYKHFFFQWQVLNYDRRLAPSHPEPVEPNPRRADSLRSSLYGAILHSEDQFQVTWALNTLRLKIDKEMQAHKFDKSEGVCGVVHVLHLKSRTATVIKVGCSSYPNLFGRNGAIRRYRKAFTPMALKKVEVISLYQNPRRALEVETELHKQLRAKFGNVNVNPHNWKAENYTKSSTWKQSWDFYVKLNRTFHPGNNQPANQVGKWKYSQTCGSQVIMRSRVKRIVFQH